MSKHTPETKILSYLRRSWRTHAQIAERFGLTRQAAWWRCRQLLEAGLIERRTDPEPKGVGRPARQFRAI